MDRHPAALYGLIARLGGYRMVLAVATVFGLVLAPTAAFAGPDLSTIVLANTLPGFVASPSGTATNGPLNQSNINYLGAGASALKGPLSSGAITGYLRTWAHEPLNGDAIVVAALWVSGPGSPSQIDSFMAGVNRGAQQAGGVPFAVPGISNAAGYTLMQSGNQIYAVTFVKDSTVFSITVLNGAHDLTSADAVSLAAQQAAIAPGGVPAPISVPASTSSGSVAYDAGQAIGGVFMTILLAVGLVLLFRGLRKRRRPSPGTRSPSSDTAFTQEPVAPFGSASPPYEPPSAPVPVTNIYAATTLPYRPAVSLALAEPPADLAPSPVEESGWKTDPADPRLIAYWDGTQYISHMRWDGAQWVDY